MDIYTDGSSIGNPGPGGYGIVMEAGGKRKELSQGFQKTTNNRMELLAVVEGLRALKRNDLDVHIFSDSKYVVNSVEKGWVFGWEKKHFKDKKNPDLWKDFLKEYRIHKPKLHWIKGHNQHPQNERCDKLAVAAAKSKNQKVDLGFEKSLEKGEGLF